MKKLIALLALTTLISGCITQGTAPDPSILRVGVSTDSQPMVFKQNGQVSGIEADFARLLGKKLNRKIVFVEIPWNKQLDYLEQNKTDIIMSGMTVTGARSIRIDFSTPYMQSGLSAIFRRDSYDISGLLGSTIKNQNKPVGYIKGTTGELFVFQRYVNSEKKGYTKSAAAISALKSGKINMFVHDAPMLWWIYAHNESDLIAFPDVLNFEPLAWGVRKGNTELLDQVNALVAQWEKDGTTQKIIKKWIPGFSH
jgi:polar amino acid transport system substrate-binding protein